MFYDLAYDLFWIMLHVLLKRLYILLSFEVFYKYWLVQVGWQFCSSLVTPCCFSALYQLLSVEYSSLQLLLLNCILLLLIFKIFASWIFEFYCYLHIFFWSLHLYMYPDRASSLLACTWVLVNFLLQIYNNKCFDCSLVISVPQFSHLSMRAGS